MKFHPVLQPVGLCLHETELLDLFGPALLEFGKLILEERMCLAQRCVLHSRHSFFSV